MNSISPFVLLEHLMSGVNTQQGGAIRPNRDFIYWCNDISKSLFEEKFAGGWEKSQKISDDLSRPFLKSVNLPVDNSIPGLEGLVPFPEDYGHISTVRFTSAIKKDESKTVLYLPIPGINCCNESGKVVAFEKNCRPAYIPEDVWEVMIAKKDADAIKKNPAYDSLYANVKTDEVTKVPNMRWGGMMADRFGRPTIDSPKITQYDGGFKVAPKGITVITVDYLRRPKEATFEYDVVPGNPQTGEGDYIVYNPLTSLPLEWSDLVINEFLIRLEKKYGKKVRESFIWETAESDRKQTV